MYRIISLTLLFIGLAHGSSSSEQLLSDLMSTYTKALKPEGTVEVGHTLSLRGIRNYEDGIITADAWVNLSWTDSRLAWNRNTYNVDKIQIPSSMIWKPDILLFSSASASSGMIYDDINAIVSHNGKVSWIPQIRLMSQCKEEGWISKNVICKWKFGSWTYDGLDINFSNETLIMDTIDIDENPKYEIVSTNANRNIVMYACCPEPYPDITYSLEFKKKFMV